MNSDDFVHERINTPLGWCSIAIEKQKLQELIFKPLQEQLDAKDKLRARGVDDVETAVRHAGMLYPIILIFCIQDAVAQAIRETIAYGLMKDTLDQHDRWALANQMADAAHNITLARVNGVNRNQAASAP